MTGTTGNEEIFQFCSRVSTAIVFISALGFAKFRSGDREDGMREEGILRAWDAHKLESESFPDSSSLSNALPWLENSTKVSPLTIACHSVLPVTEFARLNLCSLARSPELIFTLIGTGIAHLKIEYVIEVYKREISQLIIRYRTVFHGRVPRNILDSRYTERWENYANPENSKVRNIFRLISAINFTCVKISHNAILLSKES